MPHHNHLVIFFLLCSFAAGLARADHPGFVDRHRQAGFPLEVSRLAKPSLGPHYEGGYIGGGAPFFFGQPRKPDEGTWGVDYSGALFHRRVWLNWWHGSKAQGGGGAYATDGPHLKLHR